MLATQARGDTGDRLSTLPKLAPDESLARAGERLGPYRLIREIGRGGMGSVWLAARADGSFKRDVALKLPRLAWGAGLAERMARAVAYAHGRLVIHRDIKPSNVLVTADAKAHLLDFGMAKLLTEADADSKLTQEQGRVLTPHHASPEQLQGEVITVASDVYSLGVLPDAAGTRRAADRSPVRRPAAIAGRAVRCCRQHLCRHRCRPTQR